MNSSLLIDNIAGLLVVTSLLVMLVRRPTATTIIYAIQSFILVVMFVIMGMNFHAHELYSWAITSLITKVILVPLIMYFAFRRFRDEKALGTVVGAPWVIILAVIIVGLCFFAVKPVSLPMLQELKPTLAISLALFILGIVCIMTQRSILKQSFGYCLMENGSHLTLGLLAYKAPELVEVGITTDAIFAVIVMVLLVRLIYRQNQSLDVKHIMTLKG